MKYCRWTRWKTALKGTGQKEQKIKVFIPFVLFYWALVFIMFNNQQLARLTTLHGVWVRYFAVAKVMIFIEDIFYGLGPRFLFVFLLVPRIFLNWSCKFSVVAFPFRSSSTILPEENASFRPGNYTGSLKRPKPKVHSMTPSCIKFKRDTWSIWRHLVSGI